jgi:hypothetical protein
MRRIIGPDRDMQHDTPPEFDLIPMPGTVKPLKMPPNDMSTSHGTGFIEYTKDLGDRYAHLGRIHALKKDTDLLKEARTLKSRVTTDCITEGHTTR